MIKQTQHHSAKKAYRVLCMGILMLAISGCAAFQGNNLSAVTSFPITPVKKSLEIDLTFSASLNGNPITMGIDKGRKKLVDRCINRLQKSGLFGSVSENLSNPDLKLQVNVMDVGEVNIMLSMLTGFSLYIIPSSARDTYRLSAILTDTETFKKTEIKLEDSVTQWQQILLLPLMPFKFTIAELGKCQNKLFDNLALEIQKSGMLE